MRNILNFVSLTKTFIASSQKTLCCVTVQTTSEVLLSRKICYSFIASRPNLYFSKACRTFYSSCKRLDKVVEADTPKKNENIVIYYGSLTGQIKGVKVFTCLSSIIGVIMLPGIIHNTISGDNLPVGAALCTCIGFFTFVTPFLIHVLSKKYVIEIRYNPATDLYTATTLTFFLQRNNIQFKVSDVTVPNNIPIFSTMAIKGKPVFIISDCFLEIEHYIKMMKYDKPIDLSLESDNSDKVK